MDEAEARTLAEGLRAAEKVPAEAEIESVQRRLIKLDGGRRKAFVVRYVADTPHKGHYVELALGEDGSLLRVERCM